MDVYSFSIQGLDDIWGLTIYISLSLLIAIIAWKRDSLTRNAAVGAFVLASSLYLIGGTLFFILLMTFFFSSTLLSRYKSSIKAPIEKQIHEKTGARDLKQVAANGGAALIMAGVFVLTRQSSAVVAVATAFAACNADTWASEIGVLSKKMPVSLVTRKTVQPGLSGGVSALGFMASIGGALTVAVVFGVYLYFTRNQMDWVAMGLIVFGGILGSLIDSLFGATLQAKYIDRKNGGITEKKQTDKIPNKLHQGVAFINNNFVNFASSLLAATIIYFVMEQLSKYGGM